MNIQDDFEEFLQLLVEKQVDFVIVGGYAVAYHGYVRATRDIDVLVRDSQANVERIVNAFSDFGISPNDSLRLSLQEPGSIVRLGVPPVQIELINAISGLGFDEVWERRVAGHYGNVNLCYISYEDLLANKRASARPKDLADVDELGGNGSGAP